jgi:hypothetical protein
VGGGRNLAGVESESEDFGWGEVVEVRNILDACFSHPHVTLLPTSFFFLQITLPATALPFLLCISRCLLWCRGRGSVRVRRHARLRKADVPLLASLLTLMSRYYLATRGRSSGVPEQALLKALLKALLRAVLRPY